MRTKEERRAALVRKFREIGAERSARISRWWLQLEQTPGDAETAAELLREIHTLKGEAKTVGLSEVGALAHGLEALLFRARDLQFEVPRATSDAVLHAADALLQLVRADGGAPLELDRELAQLDAAVSALSQAALPTARAAAPAPAATSSAAATSGAARTSSAAGTSGAVGSSSAAHTAHGGVSPEESVRVRAARITSISDVAGEMLVSQAKIRFLVSQLRALVTELEAGAEVGAGAARSSSRLLAERVAELDEAVYQQGTYVKEMDRTARELRLVPVSTLLEPYVRMVRDLAREHGKEATLTLDARDAEADKRVLDVLDEPLMHVLRNCVDHGIESPEERLRAGKPRQGRIRVTVRPSGGSLQVTIEDDGRGLDPAALKQRAVERGFLTDAAIETLTERQAMDLVFLPGFSSRDNVTATSGRGVGMDIVKRRAEQIGGRVELRSVPGRSLSLTLTVPVSISLTRALIVQVGTHEVAIPSASIEAVRRLTREELVEGHDGLALRVEETLVPVVPLEELLTGGGDPDADLPVGLLLRSGSERRVVRVARTGGEAELVVKPLGPPLRGFQLVTGAAVLESGRVVLVLEVGALLSRARVAATAGTAQRTRAETVAARILVVDDSVILRGMMTSMLKPLGFQVFEAADGQEALEQLEVTRPDLIFTDLQMPRLDGLGLLGAVRGQARLRNLPVVILSSLGSPEDLRRGIEAGASAYLVKNDLTEEAVQQVLSRLLR